MLLAASQKILLCFKFHSTQNSNFLLNSFFDPLGSIERYYLVSKHLGGFPEILLSLVSKLIIQFNHMSTLSSQTDDVDAPQKSLVISF